MKAMARRVMRIAVMTLGFGGLIVAANAVPGVATSPVDFTSTRVATGTYASQGSLPLMQGLDIVVVSTKAGPGGSSGWHSHPGGAIVVIQAGQVTTYQSFGSHCVINTYTHGQSFIERPGVPLIAIAGSEGATIYSTLPGVPVGGSPRTTLPNPGTCPGV
jgi:quercetin dioxygenase-like cupin family protein